MYRLARTLGLLVVLFAPAMPAAADWPQFRGPSGDGVVDAIDLPTKWSTLRFGDSPGGRIGRTDRQAVAAGRSGDDRRSVSHSSLEQLCVCDGVDAQFVVALHADTGKVAWRTSRPPTSSPDGKHRRAFSTPLVVQHQQRDQLIVPGAQWVVSYDPATGAER